MVLAQIRRRTSIRSFNALASRPIPSLRFMGSCKTFSTYSCRTIASSVGVLGLSLHVSYDA
jgi:hypothetical protein